ncbi:MAG: repair protein RadC [Mucilaginibacter sp.]|nr:repair protein RadC [Mucilaginibacter sp.]
MRHSELKLSYKVHILSPPILSAADGYTYLKKIWDVHLINLQEQFYVLCLNDLFEVIAWKCLTTGTYNETLYDVKLILGCALGCYAPNIIIAHNHTNGILLPSENDLKITAALYRCAEIMDIRLLDHLIITNRGFYSFKDADKL